jgi:hypothetical protein
MESLIDYKSISFGDNFVIFKKQHPYSDNYKLFGRLSTSAIESLNYLKQYILKGHLPAYNENILGLYSYIHDREEFEEIDFDGFISLEKYDSCYLYEYYYNKSDNITIYVYDTSSKTVNKLKSINKNKILFL